VEKRALEILGKVTMVTLSTHIHKPLTFSFRAGIGFTRFIHDVDDGIICKTFATGSHNKRVDWYRITSEFFT
jgi:hypothetical protein